MKSVGCATENEGVFFVPINLTLITTYLFSSMGKAQSRQAVLEWVRFFFRQVDSDFLSTTELLLFIWSVMRTLWAGCRLVYSFLFWSELFSHAGKGMHDLQRLGHAWKFLIRLHQIKAWNENLVRFQIDFWSARLPLSHQNELRLSSICCLVQWLQLSAESLSALVCDMIQFAHW